MPSRPLTTAERTQWASLGHVLLLQSLMQASDWTREQFAFHGGTSLHLSWNSPRFSEDLDFLLERSAAQRTRQVMDKAQRRMREALLLIDPEFQIEMRDKSTERMGAFHVLLSKPGVLGKAMVKAEFWHVAPTYLAHYETTPRVPAVPTDLGGMRLRVDAMLPAATLASALADKLTAFATRPHLKWRDLFDYWWIQQQRDFVRPAPEELLERFEHHVSGYQTTVPGDAPASLRRFAALLSTEGIVEQAQRDLKQFLPQHVWRMVWPEGVRDMVQLASRDADALAARLADRADHGNGDEEAAPVERPRA